LEILTYKCKNCGGELVFDPTSQKFACHYCNSRFIKSELETPEQAEQLAETQPTETAEQQLDNTASYSCPSCGAEVVTDATTAATFCYYCHNPVVLQGRLAGNMLPSRVIPFKIERNNAVSLFLKWIKHKHFVPKDFYSQKQTEKMTGVYFPYWLVDSDSFSQMTANAEIVRTWTTGNTRYTETSHYNLIRDGEIHLEDVIKTALKKANKKLVEAVQPFDEQDLQKFSTTYLSGFLAEKRDIEQAELEEEVLKDINNFCEQILKNTMSSYSSVSPISKNTTIQNIAWEYCLLPVWTVTYNYKGEIYYFALNGQTGKTCGKLPVDMKKLVTVAGGISAVLLGLLSIGGYLI